uniref:Putative pre-mRNA splicing factor SF3a n=1 Tax=Arabidopsis thaliana TaxID=3702 RepID=Q93Y03_ARATH|nr:putative pre-mRNA splicing factor SF3a [Arabidopsis thaliana]AAM10214.1 putative pre-mRNA splicing factor SF3a [Arabidopsis thaliana]
MPFTSTSSLNTVLRIKTELRVLMIQMVLQIPNLILELLMSLKLVIHNPTFRLNLGFLLSLWKLRNLRSIQLDFLKGSRVKSLILLSSQHSLWHGMGNRF